MKIEAGKRYVRRDGKISGVIEDGAGSPTHAFTDGKWYYREDGTGNLLEGEALIREYIEPAAGLASRHEAEAEAEPDYSQDDLTRHANATGFITSDYRRGINDAVLWLVANYATYKPEYLAENMLEELK